MTPRRTLGTQLERGVRPSSEALVMNNIARIFKSLKLAFGPAAPARNRMLVEAIEPRILHSADISPLHLVDQSVSTIAETRYIGGDGEFIQDSSLDAQQQAHEIIFVDTATPDYQKLIDQIVSGSDRPDAQEVVLIESGSDGIQAISDVLSSRTDVSAIHIISHGSDGQIQLGSTTLNGDSLAQRADEIAAWANAFTEDGDILVYGCNIAATESGQGLVDNLAALTKTDVAASEDLTGTQSLGGDWDLEYRSGDVQTHVLMAAAEQQSWNALLVAPVIDLDADDSSGATGANFQTVFVDAQVGGPVNITDTDVTITDVDSTTLTSAWIVLTNQQDGTNKETLSASAGTTGLTVTWTAANSTLTITGNATLADYESVFASATYFNSQNNPNTTDRNIKFVAYDGTTVSSVAITTVRVIQSTPGNDVPVATNSLVSGTEDTPYAFSATDFKYFDVEGDALVSATITNLALAGGTLTYNGGTTLVAGSTLTAAQLNTLVYTPAADANGSPLATFDFTVNDSGTGVVAAKMNIQIAGVNDVPALTVPGAQTVNEDTPLTIGGISASDVDGNLDSVSVGVSNGTLTVTLAGAASISAGANGSGSLTVSGIATDINATLASLTYQATADFNGADTLTIVATDTAAATDSASVGITVDPVNDAPVAYDDSYSVNHDQVLIVNALTANATASDLGAAWQLNDGTGASAADATGNGNDGILNGATWTTSSRTGDSALAFDGTSSYVQTTNSTLDLSTATSFTLSAWFQTDTTTGQHHILWQGVSTQNGWGDPADNSPTSSEMHLTVGRYNANDKITFFLGYDANDPNSIDITSASNFTDTSGWHQAVVVVSDLGGGSLQADLYVDGVLEGSDTGTQTDRLQWDTDLRFGRPGVATRFFDGKIDDVGIYDRALTPAEVSALHQTGILQNDTDAEGDTLTVNTTPVTNVSNGTLVLNADGSFTYTPNAGFVGTDSFTYEVTDGALTSNIATVTINVVNNAPVAADDGYVTDEDTGLTAVLGANDLLQNDIDLDGDSLSVNTTPVVDVSNGTLVLNGDGTFSYTPNANFSGTDSFVYEVSDAYGATAQATASITVNAINDAPTTSAVTLAAIAEDSGARLITQAELLSNANDVDGDPLTAQNLSISAGSGTLVDNLNGTWTYTPALNDDTAVSFSYDITDGTATINSGTASLDITPVNDAPVAGDDIYIIDEDTTLAAVVGVDDLLLNDSDLDGDTLSVVTTPIADVSNGVLVLNTDGTFTYTPNPDFNGLDGFIYQVVDGKGGSAQGSVTITINPVDDPLDGGLLAAIDTQGNPPVVSGTVNEVGAGTADASEGGGGSETQRDMKVIDDLAILSAHDASSDTPSYLGFSPSASDNGAGASKSGDGSVDGDVSGDGTAWVTYRHRAIEWLVASAYPVDGSNDSGNDRIVAGNALGLNAYSAGLAGDLVQFDGDHHKIMLIDGMQFASIALTVGAVGWAVRAGGLLTSLLVGMPVWREFDPLPVVAEDKDAKKQVQSDDDSDTDEEELAANLLETGQFNFGARE